MNFNKIFGLVVLINIFFNDIKISAQTGPGGVGNVADLLLWLRAEDICGLSDGDVVDIWSDISGNGLRAEQPDKNKRPVYKAKSSINNYPALYFDGNNDYLYIQNTDALINSETMSLFIVLTPLNLNNINQRGILSRRCMTIKPNDLSYTLSFYRDNKMYVDIDKLKNIEISNNTFENGTAYILEVIYDANQSSSNKVKIYCNGFLDKSSTENYNLRVKRSEGIYLGNLSESENKCLEMELSEVIIYKRVLSNAERILVENYLSAKYNINVDNDLYSFKTNYGNDVAGIYKLDALDFVDEAQGTSILKVSSPTDFENNEALLWGHNNSPLGKIELTNIPSGIKNRISRVWKFTEKGDVGFVNILFDISAFNISSVSGLELLIDDNDNFSNAKRHTTGRSLSNGMVVFTNVNINNGDYVTLGSNEQISFLPVEISRFSVELNGNDAILSWRTENEVNNDRFEVYRSSDGLYFDYIASVKGAGNSNKPKHYEAIDPNLPDGTYYYRLKQVDFDGKYKWSDILSLNKYDNGSICEFTIKPNPCVGRCFIDFDNCESEEFKEVNFEVYDISGNLVYTSIKQTIVNGEARFIFDPSNNLKPAIYVVKGKNSSNSIKEKKLIVH